MLPVTAAVGLLVGMSAMSARAADEAAGKGKVSGTVVDKDGKGVAGVEVHLIKPMRRGPGGGAPAEGRKPADQAAVGTKAVALQETPAAPGQGRQRPEPVAKATTDKDGKFEMKDVPAGDYVAMVRDDDKKVYGMGRVTVKEGETASVEIKTTDQPLRGGRRGGAGGAGGGEQK
jgi:hypothetical protein